MKTEIGCRVWSLYEHERTQKQNEQNANSKSILRAGSSGKEMIASFYNDMRALTVLLTPFTHNKTMVALDVARFREVVNFMLLWKANEKCVVRIGFSPRETVHVLSPCFAPDTAYRTLAVAHREISLQ